MMRRCRNLRHSDIRPMAQALTNLLHALAIPSLISQLAKREQQRILILAHEVIWAWWRLGDNHIDILADVVAELVEWKIVNVVSKGILDFAADEGNSKDDVGGEDRGWNGDPAERLVELEGEEQNVDPGDLANGDRIRDGERGVEDAVGSGEDVVHGSEGVQGLGLIDGDLEGAIVIEQLHVRRQMGKDLKREITERAVGALEELAGIGLGHGNTQELAKFLELGNVPVDLWDISFLRIGIEMADKRLQVLVMHERLESEFVLQRHGEGDDQVHAADFVEQVLLAQLTLALVNVHPDQTGQILRRQRQLCPVFSSFIVPFVRGGAAEAERQTDDETEDCEKELADTDWMDVSPTGRNGQ